jgi:hypothetical protein
MGARSTAARPWLCPISICTDPVCESVVCVSESCGVLRDCSVECKDEEVAVMDNSEGKVRHGTTEGSDAKLSQTDKQHQLRSKCSRSGKNRSDGNRRWKKNCDGRKKR